ncbi:MAG: ATP-binding protein [bacterium]
MKLRSTKENKAIRFIMTMAITGCGVILFYFSLHFLDLHLYMKYEQLHSALEIFGVMSALLMALVLLQKDKEENNPHFFFVALGLITMGILNGFHAVALTQNKIIFLHSAASFFGGLLFSLVWLPRSLIEKYSSHKKVMVLFTITSSLVCGAFVLLLPDIFSALYHNGEFSFLAIALNYCAFLFFFLAGWRFFLDYCSFGTYEVYLLLYLTLFLGLAHLCFSHSTLWDLEWWVWHILSLGAFFLELVFVIRHYINTTAELSSAYAEWKRAEEDKKKMRTELQHAYKIESLGALAGGIAHEFNNILGIIIGNIELAKIKIPSENPMHQTFNQIFKACLRARDVVRQILIFSRQRTERKELLQISSIVKDALKLLRATLPTTIEIYQHIDSCASSLVDYTQIQQVLMNLCSNAAHAMREHGGMLKVDVIDIHIDEETGRYHNILKPGTYVRLTVSDTGHGIDHRIIDRIFDPYFTTKDIGSGTGMGLAVVHEIVKKHSGTITVRSDIGQGATFQLFFPTFEGKSSQIIEDPLFLPKGTERILFVDDEKDLVDMGEEILSSLGYEIIATSCPVKAFETFRTAPDTFDLVITDQTMPSMTGAVLAKKLMTIKPDIPIILCTGYNESVIEEDIKAMGIREYFMKPIIKNEIAETIRKVLDKDNNEL